MNAPIRILLVDDHNLFRRGLAALLAQEPTLQVVGQAGDAGEAQRLLAELRPDVMLLDNHLPGVRGVDAIPGLREVHPGCRIIVLTVSEDGADLAAALKAGAAGYLLKTVEGEMLIDGIRRAMRGESVVSPEMTEKLIAAFRSATASSAQAEEAEEPESDAAHGGLSPRETEILREQQGDRAHPRHRRDDRQDPRAAHPAQAQPHLAGAGRRVCKRARPGLRQRKHRRESGRCSSFERQGPRALSFFGSRRSTQAENVRAGALFLQWSHRLKEGKHDGHNPCRE